MSEEKQTELKSLVIEILTLTRNEGASAAEVSASTGSGFSVEVRLGEVETVEYNRDKGVSITVYFGQRKGSASTSDTSLEAIQATVKAACHIARYTSEDPCAGLADPNLMAYGYPDLNLYHPWQLTVEQGIDLARECEEVGRTLDKRITNSDGTSLSTHQHYYVYGNSHGFIGDYASTRHSLSSMLIAQDGAHMQRDYSYTVARDPQDLLNPHSVARDAVARTVRRLGARKLATRQAPVIFEANIASTLMGAFLQAIQGGNLYRKASFLVDHLGETIFPDHIHIYESPHLLKALGSAPFDSEGVVTRQRDLVSEGILQSYILSSYSARKLGMQSTGNAGGVHNVFVKTADITLAGLLKRMDKGLLVTELMGQGINLVTGDYSRGAAGFWVENGVIQYPVEEITIAGNLRDMFAHLVTVANDVDDRVNIHTGSILLENMTIAGE